MANGTEANQNLYDLGVPNAIVIPNPQESLPDLAISEVELEEIPEDDNEFDGLGNALSAINIFNQTNPI